MSKHYLKRHRAFMWAMQQMALKRGYDLEDYLHWLKSKEVPSAIIDNTNPESLSIESSHVIRFYQQRVHELEAQLERQIPMARKPATETDMMEPREDEFEQYSFEQLLSLNSRLKTELQKRQAAELEAHKQKTYQLTQALGISVEQLYGLAARQARKARGSGNGKQPARIGYRDPANPDNVGSVKGPAPQWLKDYMAQGRSKDEFRVNE